MPTRTVLAINLKLVLAEARGRCSKWWCQLRPGGAAADGVCSMPRRGPEALRQGKAAAASLGEACEPSTERPVPVSGWREGDGHTAAAELLEQLELVL